MLDDPESTVLASVSAPIAEEELEPEVEEGEEGAEPSEGEEGEAGRGRRAAARKHRPRSNRRCACSDGAAESSIDWLVVGLGQPRRALPDDPPQLPASWWPTGWPSAGRELAVALRRALQRGPRRRAAAGAAGAGDVHERLRPQRVGAALRYFKLEPAQLLVVHDEIDLPLGDVRAKLGGGLAGHNGLRSLADHLRTQDFARVRVGVGRPERGDPRPVVDWVLTPFPPAPTWPGW